MTAEFPRDAIATAAVFGFFASAWFGWAQDQPNPAWHRWLVAGSILSCLPLSPGGAGTSRTFGIVVGVELTTGPPEHPGQGHRQGGPSTT